MDANWTRCYSAFLAHIESISGSTRSRATYAFTLDTFFVDHDPATATRADVQNYLDEPSHLKYQQGQPVKAGTVNQRLMCLNSFYKFAATFEVDGMLLFEGRPPAFGIQYLKVGSSPKGLSASELSQFFSVIPTNSVKGLRDRAAFLTYFFTAKRRSEIAHLTVGDIQEATLIDSVGHVHQGHIFQYRAKGRSRIIATAELPPIAYNAIIAYWRESGRLDALTPDSPVFASTRPDQPEQQLTGDYMNTLFKFYNAKASLDPHYSLHSLRHSSARQRYELGSDIRAIQETLGHTSLSTTSLYLKSLTVTHDSGADLLTERFGHLGKL